MHKFSYYKLMECYFPLPDDYICKIYEDYLNKNKNPNILFLKTYEKIEHNGMHTFTQLKDHLVSLRIVFVQIWESGYKKCQLGLIGFMTNALVNI